MRNCFFLSGFFKWTAKWERGERRRESLKGKEGKEGKEAFENSLHLLLFLLFLSFQKKILSVIWESQEPHGASCGATEGIPASQIHLQVKIKAKKKENKKQKESFIQNSAPDQWPKPGERIRSSCRNTKIFCGIVWLVLVDLKVLSQKRTFSTSSPSSPFNFHLKFKDLCNHFSGATWASLILEILPNSLVGNSLERPLNFYSFFFFFFSLWRNLSLHGGSCEFARAVSAANEPDKQAWLCRHTQLGWAQQGIKEGSLFIFFFHFFFWLFIFFLIFQLMTKAGVDGVTASMDTKA